MKLVCKKCNSETSHYYFMTGFTGVWVCDICGSSQGFPTPKLKCPKCGYVPSTNETININFEPYVGDYCMKCYAKWISENISKMVVDKE